MKVEFFTCSWPGCEYTYGHYDFKTPPSWAVGGIRWVKFH